MLLAGATVFAAALATPPVHRMTTDEAWSSIVLGSALVYAPLREPGHDVAPLQPFDEESFFAVHRFVEGPILLPPRADLSDPDARWQLLTTCDVAAIRWDELGPRPTWVVSELTWFLKQLGVPVPRHLARALPARTLCALLVGWRASARVRWQASRPAEDGARIVDSPRQLPPAFDAALRSALLTEAKARRSRHGVDAALEGVVAAVLSAFVLWPWAAGRTRVRALLHVAVLPGLLLAPFVLGFRSGEVDMANPRWSVARDGPYATAADWLTERPRMAFTDPHPREPLALRAPDEVRRRPMWPALAAVSLALPGLLLGAFVWTTLVLRPPRSASLRAELVRCALGALPVAGVVAAALATGGLDPTLADAPGLLGGRGSRRVATLASVGVASAVAVLALRLRRPTPDDSPPGPPESRPGTVL